MQIIIYWPEISRWKCSMDCPLRSSDWSRDSSLSSTVHPGKKSDRHHPMIANCFNHLNPHVWNPDCHDPRLIEMTNMILRAEVDDSAVLSNACRVETDEDTSRRSLAASLPFSIYKMQGSNPGRSNNPDIIILDIELHIPSITSHDRWLIAESRGVIVWSAVTAFSINQMISILWPLSCPIFLPLLLLPLHVYNITIFTTEENSYNTPVLRAMPSSTDFWY